MAAESQVLRTSISVHIIVISNNISIVSLFIDIAYFVCSAYVLSVPWHLLSFCDFITELILSTVRISSLIVILWFSNSGWLVTSLTSKWFLKWCFNYRISSKKRPSKNCFYE